MEYYTLREVMTLLRLSKSTVRRMGLTGILPYIKVGKRGCWRFPINAVREYLNFKV